MRFKRMLWVFYIFNLIICIGISQQKSGIIKYTPSPKSTDLIKSNNSNKKVLVTHPHQTPRGTPVNCTIENEWNIPSDPDYITWQYDNYGYYYDDDDNFTIGNASNTYNCHGYAWHTDTAVVMDESVNQFWIDGSYNVVDEAEAEKIVYTSSWPTNAGHSALKSPQRPGYYRSKWILGRLVDHLPSQCPWGAGQIVGLARAHDYPDEENSVASAVANSLNSQTVNVNEACTLTCDIVLAGKRKLNANSLVTLGGHYIKVDQSNETGYISGSFSPIWYTVYKNTRWVGIYSSTFSEALSNTNDGETIVLGHDESLNDNLALGNKILQINSGVSFNLAGKNITGEIIDQGADWQPCNIKLYSNGVQIGQYSSLNDISTSSGQTIVLGSNYILQSNFTIPAGVTFIVSSGSTLNLNGYSINVSGTISASGVTFTNGSSINLTSSSSSSFSGCIFSGLSTGLYLSNSSISISGCRFNNCGYGINCTNYSSPSISSNIFYGNNYDIVGDNTSSPNCSSSNSFRYPGYYQVYSAYSGTIYAYSNYWGDCPVTPIVTNNVNSSYYSCTDMNPPSMGFQDEVRKPEVVQAKKSIAAHESQQTISEPGIKEVDAAFLLYVKEKYTEAQTEFEKIVDKYPDSFAGNISLVMIEICLEKSGKKDQTFEKMNSISSKYSGKAVSKFAESRKIYQYLLQGKYNDAVSQAAEVLKSMTDTTLIKMTLFDLGTLYWFNNKDKNQGEQYYKELIKRFPYDMLSIIAQTTLGNGSKYNDKPVKSTGSTPESLSIQNYPNPFNPSTKITYSIPENSNVNIMIYNSLGQEIRTLVNEYKTAGVYSIEWNPGNIPSGLYYYKIKTDKASEMKKMMFIK